ncbi:CRISPR-associated endonuclease Cas3'' [Magnetofaba australis]|uniref:HD Cas3-type domain-containing protein n=1 Tax=Magnetofaba australis IT-1 TaxID=1434232 RepID=A0A1Y2K0Q1_9PROT|nr:CRISPR-associated endonuclease Cas3'' [Magnetofaba australis]OSM00333.1 hypothetical protein MAIT1_00829 [Magnetofaba australis IT-1]
MLEDNHLKNIPWGKLTRDASGKVSATLSIADHSADVAATLEAMLRRAAIRQGLAQLAGWDDLTPVHCARLALLAGLHDIGKFNRGFQNKATGRGSLRGHVAEGMWGLIEHAGQILQSLSVRMGNWCESEAGLLELIFASISHHGQTPPKWKACDIGNLIKAMTR